MLLSTFSDAQNIISIITSIIDMFAISVIAVTLFTSILPLIKSTTSSLLFLIKLSRQTNCRRELCLKQKSVKRELHQRITFSIGARIGKCNFKDGCFYL